MLPSKHLREAQQLFVAIATGGDGKARKVSARRFVRLQRISPTVAALLRSWLETKERGYLLPEEVPDTDDGF